MEYRCPLKPKSCCRGCYHFTPHEFEAKFCTLYCQETVRACTCTPVQPEYHLVGDPSLVTSSAVVPEFVRKLDTSE